MPPTAEPGRRARPHADRGATTAAAEAEPAKAQAEAAPAEAADAGRAADAAPRPSSPTSRPRSPSRADMAELDADGRRDAARRCARCRGRRAAEPPRPTPDDSRRPRPTRPRPRTESGVRRADQRVPRAGYPAPDPLRAGDAGRLPAAGRRAGAGIHQRARLSSSTTRRSCCSTCSRAAACRSSRSSPWV